MNVLGPAVLSLLLTGCFVEVGGGYYATTHSEGTTPLTGIDTGGTGSAFRLSLGLEVDADFLILGVAAAAGAAESGELTSLGKGVQVDARKRLFALNDDTGVYVDGSVLYGSGSEASYTPVAGGDPVQEEGGTTLDLYGGAALIYDLGDNRISLGAGLGVISRSNEVFGNVKGIGPEVRVRFTWNSFLSSDSGGSTPSSGRSSKKGTIYSAETSDSWMVALNMGAAGTAASDAIDTLKKSAADMSCSNITSETGHSFSAVCLGKPVLVSIDTEGGSDFYSVQCEASEGKKSCEILFHILLKTAK